MGGRQHADVVLAPAPKVVRFGIAGSVVGNVRVLRMVRDAEAVRAEVARKPARAQQAELCFGNEAGHQRDGGERKQQHADPGCNPSQHPRGSRRAGIFHAALGPHFAFHTPQYGENSNT